MKEYKFITNFDELDTTKDIWYFELFPGKKRNDNSVFLSEYSMEVVEDIFAELDKYYDRYGSTVYNEDQIKIIEQELLKRKNEIENIGSYTFIEGKLNSFYYNELIKNIDKNRGKILKMLEEIIDWIKTVNENEISLIGL